MEVRPLGWMIHEKARHLLCAFDERIEDQFEWVTEALAEAKKTLTDPTIQLIPKTPSEKKKRLRIWRRHGAALGYRRFSNRTSSFRGSYVSMKKSPPGCSDSFSNAEISVCRTNLLDNFSETTPKSSSWLNQQQPCKAVSTMSVSVQTDDVFIVQSVEPVSCLLGSGEPDICKENGYNRTVVCNGTQSVKHQPNCSVDWIDFLSEASDKCFNGFCGREGEGFFVDRFGHETNYLILDGDGVRKCLSSELVERILPASSPDECGQVAVLQTKVHRFEHHPHLQSIILTFKKTAAYESEKGGSEAVLSGDASEALQQTSKTGEQPPIQFQDKTQRRNSAAEPQQERSTGNNLLSPTKTIMSLAPEIVDLTILGTGFPVKRPASVRRSSSVSSLSSAGSRSPDSLDVRVSVGTDGERRSTAENRDSVYGAVSYDSYEQNTRSIATAASVIGNCDVSGIEVIPDDATEQAPNNAPGVCCNPSLFSLSKICGAEINSDDALSEDEDVEDAAKEPRKRRSRIPGKPPIVKQRPSYVGGPRMSVSKRKSLVKASGGRKSLLRSRLTTAQKNSFPTVKSLEKDVVSAEPNPGLHTTPSKATNNRCGAAYRIYKSAKRRSSALAVTPVLGGRTAPSLRYPAQKTPAKKTPARKDLPTGDGTAAKKSGGMTAGKRGSARRSIAPVTPVAVSKSRVQKLRKLFSPLSKSKTPVPNGATQALTPRPAPALPGRQSKLQMWRGVELSQLPALPPGSPSTGKTWYKASSFMHCFNSPRRSSIIENRRVKGQLAPATNASLCSKSRNRFTKGNQKSEAPHVDTEQSATPRRGLFKRLQDKMKTPGKESPHACLAVGLKRLVLGQNGSGQNVADKMPVLHRKAGPLSQISETTKVVGASKFSNSNNCPAENSLPVQTGSSSSACITSAHDCASRDVGGEGSAGHVEPVKALQDAELKTLIDVCSVDPSASADDDPLIVASSDALSSYDISDLRPDSDDSDDEETSSTPPSKTQVRMVPLWAEGKRLALALVDLHLLSMDVEKIFGEIVAPDLNRMFDKKKPRFDKRTSSANWEHPLDIRPFQL